MLLQVLLVVVVVDFGVVVELITIFFLSSFDLFCFALLDWTCMVVCNVCVCV